MGFRGREHEDHVLRRLLQRLEQRVERGLGQHVYLVDEVDLMGVLTARGREIGLLS